MTMDPQLTPEQITNWRKVLSMMIGPYALLMPDEEVQKFRDKMQGRIDSEEIPSEETEETT